eukprot:1160897-Pelagomonas_calceolata.AAC.13
MARLVKFVRTTKHGWHASKVRGKLYELLANCIPPELIIKKLLAELLKRLDDDIKQIWAAKALMSTAEHGKKEILHRRFKRIKEPCFISTKLDGIEQGGSLQCWVEGLIRKLRSVKKSSDLDWIGMCPRDARDACLSTQVKSADTWSPSRMWAWKASIVCCAGLRALHETFASWATFPL